MLYCLINNNFVLIKKKKLLTVNLPLYSKCKIILKGILRILLYYMICSLCFYYYYSFLINSAYKSKYAFNFFTQLVLSTYFCSITMPMLMVVWLWGLQSKWRNFVQIVQMLRQIPIPKEHQYHPKLIKKETLPLQKKQNKF